MMRSTIRGKYLVMFALAVILALGVVATRAQAAPLSSEAQGKLPFTISQIIVQGNTLISDRSMENITRRFLGERKTARDLELLQEAVFNTYKTAGYPLVSVAIFEVQDSLGQYTVVVKEDILRNIELKGNKILQEKHIRAILPALKPGASINVRNLDKQVLAANENPSRAIAVGLQTIDVGVFDAVVNITEGKMFTNTLTLDNTGNRYQEPLRYKYQFVHNALGPAQDATGAFVYIRSPNKITEQGLLYYNQPIHSNGGNIAVMAVKANSDSGVSQTGYGDYNVNGSGQFYSLHFTQPLYRTAWTKLAFDLGLEYHATVDNTSIFGIDVGPDVNARPLNLGLHYTRQGKRNNFSASINHVRNLAGGYLNDDDTYYIIRPNAVASYQLWRGNLSYLYRFKNGWLFNSRCEWQYATQPLIPDQQFGLGGAQSVRGFETRELLGDKGIGASFEIYTPPVSKGLRFLAFFDIGQAWVFDLYGDLSEPSTISSTGVGIRWRINPVFSFSADYAYVIKGYLTPDHDTRLHFELSATF